MLSPGDPVPEIPLTSLFPDSLRWAHPLVQEWFVRRFGTPTEPQELGWPVIADGRARAHLRTHRLRQDPRGVSHLYRRPHP